MSNEKEGAFATCAIGLQDNFHQPGLTKLEYLAASAMNGILSNQGQIDTTDYNWVAKNALGYAKALLAELEKEAS